MNQSGLHGQMRLEGGMSTSNVSLAGMVKHANEVSPFDPLTGEFKASLVGRVEKKASKRNDALKAERHNVVRAEERRMDSGDGAKTSDKDQYGN